MMLHYLAYSKDIAYLILFAISVYGWWHGRDKEKSDRIEQFVKINWKLDTMCQSQTDIKDDVRELKKLSSDTDKRLTLIEEQMRVANNRIDTLERNYRND